MDVCALAVHGQARYRTEHTDEPTWVLFTWFGAPANVTYSLDVGGLKAQLIALAYDEAILNPQAQGGDDGSPVHVVIPALNDLQQKVGLFIVEVIGQPTRERGKWNWSEKRARWGGRRGVSKTYRSRARSSLPRSSGTAGCRADGSSSKPCLARIV